MPTFDRQPITLLSNASATGTAKQVKAGTWAFAADGTFNSGTAKLAIKSPDGTNFIDVGGDAILSAEGVVLVELPDCEAKCVLTGASSAMYATLTPIQA